MPGNATGEIVHAIPFRVNAIGKVISPIGFRANVTREIVHAIRFRVNTIGELVKPNGFRANVTRGPS